MTLFGDMKSKASSCCSSLLHILFTPTVKVSVFGAAPSLTVMRKMNKKKTTFYGATFWYYYRMFYPYLFPVVFIIFLIIALTAWNTVKGHLVLGSILSLISSVSVVMSYIMIMPWRKHPSSLILYRALTSTVFSVNILMNAIDVQSTTCRNYAVVTQIMLLAGESWLTTIALDLVKSLTNPFTSYKGNMKSYHMMVWTFTGALSFIFYFNKDCQGRFDHGICWVKISSTHSPCLWGYFLFWIVCMYAYQMWASLFAYLRLRRGLPLTFEIRKQCAVETFKCLAVYAAYLSVMMFFFSIISSLDPNPPLGSPLNDFSLFLLFIVANRGSVDGIVWFMLHDFMRDKEDKKNENVRLGSTNSLSETENGEKNDNNENGEYAGDTGKVKILEHGEIESPGKLGRRPSIFSAPIAGIGAQTHKTEKALKKGILGLKKGLTDFADLAIAEFDEADLSPQVNMALRQQIVQYVTAGVRNAVRRTNLTPPRKSAFVDIFNGGFSSKKDPAVVPGLEVLEFLLEGEHPFKSFAPGLFQELRMNEGISDERFLKVLSSTANEKLSEGASGAFMFFCGGGEFIVKTIRAREAKVLHQSLRTYHTFLKNNKNSLLCRFLGSFSLGMYAQTFYFVVMANCFDPKADINERFDIKGSWVGRSADPVKPTKKVVCRHCNTLFVPISKEQCTVVIGRHEANVVLKDNDLHIKISLDPTQAADVIEILKKDSNLLARLGVIDYSLLVGVKKRKFAVEVTDEEMGAVGSDLSPTPLNPSTNTPNVASSSFRAASVTGPAIYYLGIVDFLQDWSTKKKIERAFKIYFGRKDPDGLSVMEPKPYKLRFQGKMDQIFDIDGTGISSALGPGMSWKEKGNDSNSMSEKRNENEGEILVGNYGHEIDSSFFSYKNEEEDDEDEEEKEKEKEKGLGENEKMHKKDDNYEIDVGKNPPSNTEKIDGNDYEIVNTDTVVNPMMINVSVMGDDDDEEGEDNDEEEIDGVNQIRSKR